MAEEASGLLSPERNESIFRNDILRDYLPDSVGRATHPRLILLGGQPGAGKSAVLAASEAELSRSGPTIRIVGDDLRSYHPQFLAFQRQDPETASTYTQIDAGRWTERLLAAASERQVSIVFETTLRTPENVTRVIRTARDAGYAVEVRAVAVNPRLSWQGTHYRFEEMLHAGQAARIPPQRVHDAAVDGLRVTLDMLERERLVDRMQLRTRGGAVIYDNEVRDGQWARTPASRETLERVQSQPMTRGELQRFADDWNHVLGRMEERNAPADRIAAIEARAAEDVAQLLAQRREADGAQSQRSNRTILRSSQDGHALFAEFYDNAVRDAERRPIDNVASHAMGRLTQTYTALRLVEAARDLGLLPDDGTIVATRAIGQGKRATREFPAAHRLPVDLVVERRDGTRRRLTEYFGDAFNREAIDRDVFSPTDRMSRLANVVDSWLGTAGMRKAFARAIESVDEGHATVNEAMTWIVEPGYAAAVEQTRQRLDRNMALAERAAFATTIVDAQGEPIRVTRNDHRLHAANLDNRARASAMMGAVLDETARHGRLDPESRRQADAFVHGLAERERLGLEFDRRLDREIASARGDALVPAKHLPDLTDGAINERLRRSALLAEKRAEIENLSRLVFGNNGAVSPSLARITDGRTGLIASVEVHDGRFGDMAGTGRTWLHGPSVERQTAEAHAPKLAAALADYGMAIEFERHQIVTRHREEQARQRVEVPNPSSTLSAVLAAAPNEQVRRMNAEPTLRREIESLTLAITKRLSPSEKAELRDGNVTRLASSLRISQEQGARLRQVHEGTRALQERVMRQNRELARANQLDIRR